MILTIKKMAALAICAAVMPLASQALTLTLGGPPQERTATLADAVTGFSGTGNATAATVNGYYPAPVGPWTEVGSISAGSGVIVNGGLTINLLTGSWGSTAASGTWTINDPNFWTTYANAAISLHVGNGNGDPDHFVWLITPGQNTGTWSYEKLTGEGGGLSNLKLYGAGKGTTSVPDAGSSLALLGFGLVGFGIIRRKLS